MRLLLVLLLGILLYLLYASASSLLPSPSLHLSAEQARRQRFALILDARTPRDREEGGFYPNSIPVDPATVQDEVPFLLGQRPTDRTPRATPILVYSQAGDGKAKQVAETLYTMGYTGVRYLTESYVSLLPPGGSALSSDAL
jgi:rhodanese-related sulfurtransferase